MISFDNPIRMVSELKGARMAIVWVILSNRHRVSQDYLETVTSYTDKTVSQALAYLREVGLADHTSSGWQLTTSAAQQLPMILGLEPGSQLLINPGDSEVHSDHDDYPQDLQITADNCYQGRNYSDPSESLVVEAVNINKNIKNIITSTSTDSSSVGKIPTIDEIQKVLDAAEILFDHEILGNPRDYSDIDRLLAWICQANDQKGNGHGKVTNPAGLIYWAFHQGKEQKPRKKYCDFDNAERYVPESFMRRSGQWIFSDQENQDDE